MEKLSFEEFEEHMIYIRERLEFDNNLQDMIFDYTRVFADGLVPVDLGTSHITSLMNRLLDIPIDRDGMSTLDWWVFELDFGHDFKIGDIENTKLPDTHKYRRPDLTDLRKLYDYLIWESENCK